MSPELIDLIGSMAFFALGVAASLICLARASK